uniref:Uncharacterized protein n=1 Tax=Pithovirus LCDPAC02 TaxID=2506601 RepID=A0A481YNN4_9VIRU|nr:MAG: hypothetical protein LCDPAC02_01010 [Pithovirus LCDPAC02]
MYRDISNIIKEKQVKRCKNKIICEAFTKKGLRCRNKFKYEFKNKYYCGIHCKNSNRIELKITGSNIMYNYIQEEYLIDFKILLFKILDMIGIHDKDIKDINLFKLYFNWNTAYYAKFILYHDNIKYCISKKYINDDYKMWNNVNFKEKYINNYKLDKIIKHYNKMYFFISKKRCIFDKYIRENLVRYEHKLDDNFFKRSISNLDIVFISKLYNISF